MDEVDAVTAEVISYANHIEATTTSSEEVLILLEQPEIIKDNLLDCTETEQEEPDKTRLILDEYVDAYKQILEELDAEKELKRDEKEDIIRERDATKEELNELKKKLDEVNAKYSKSGPRIEKMNKYNRLASCIEEYEDSIRCQDERHDALKATATALLKCAKQSKRVKEEFLAIELEKLNETLRKYQILSAVLKDMIKIKSNETIQLDDTYDEILTELYL